MHKSKSVLLPDWKKYPYYCIFPESIKFVFAHESNLFVRSYGFICPPQLLSKSDI